MNPYDKEKTRQIWKRVLGEEESEPDCALDSERLRVMIENEKTASCTYSMMARRAGSCGGDLLRRLAKEEAAHAKKLETVYFLWTGEHACAVSGNLPKFACIAEGLRQIHGEELKTAKLYQRTAEELPEFRDLFLCLSADETRHSEEVRRLLQKYV